ncbi:phosphatase PAP2 family protein [Actinomycetospora endophytica]|uniref:Phosphatase PAP2 family protein n=1 Tax=Actinomycetospora endophytica TaxID=2291215 RepID=A0ABS8PJ45_9PSEU|nr:phosphatase PAP2 family protein [Actinomycetospora endophytica]MCD2197947.1 phosphatase PAP2 family protein [Actinomycetospora endophytica]
MILTPAGSTGAVAGSGLTHQRRWESARLAVFELVLLVVLLHVYDLVAPHAAGDVTDADAHSRAVWGLESAWGIDVEPSWYAALAGHPWLSGAAHLYYADSIYLAPALVAILLVVRDVEGYRSMRTAFVATTLIAYAAFWLYPTAPPCLLPGSGLTCGEPAPPDPFAAMPSLHVAWAGVVAIGLALLSTQAWVRALGVVHVVVTIAVVLATGHHFVLDTVAGLVVAAGAFALTRVLPGREASRGSDPIPVLI